MPRNDNTSVILGRSIATTPESAEIRYQSRFNRDKSAEIPHHL